jgi:hypothetical protein
LPHLVLLHPPDSVSQQWEGAFDAEGLPTGKGVMKYPPPPPKEGEEESEEAPTDVYEGEMLAGQRHGKGKYTWANGSSYEGGYAYNKKQGNGTRKFPDGGVYEGGWDQDLMDGSGKYVYANGDVYLGGFSCGLKHFSGSYFHRASSSQYIGEWYKGEMRGGRWVLVDGTKYEGMAGDLERPYDRALYTTGVFVEARLAQNDTLYPLKGTVDKIEMPVAAVPVDAPAE